MIGAIKRSADRATREWEPLGEVLAAVGGWVPTEDQYQIGRADGSKRGSLTRGLAKDVEAGLLNGVLYSALMPDRGDLDVDDVPYLVPVFVPVRFSRSRGEESMAAVEVLGLAVSIDGTPLGELSGLPTLKEGSSDRHAVELTMTSPKHKVLEDGTFSFSVGFGPGPPPRLSWPTAGGGTRAVVLHPGVPIPPDAPSWAHHVRIRTALGPLSQRDLSVCYAVASELGNRSTARLLAQFRPMVAGRMKHHAAVNAENLRIGGMACAEEDRRNDLYECLVLHVRNYVSKAVRDHGGYTRDLFAYVSSCFKPAAARAMLAYGPRTGHQDPTGESVNVSELVGSLRQHAAIFGLTDPAAAQAHHAVNWMLSRRLRARLDSGELGVADLWDMWERGDLPSGLKVPDLALWEMAIGHSAVHLHLHDSGGGDDGAPLVDRMPDGTVAWPGAGSSRPKVPAEEDLDLLTHPSAEAIEASGFFAITSEVAGRLAADEAGVWNRAVGEGRAVNRLLRTVMEPFAAGGGPKEAASRLHESCTVRGRWLSGDALVDRWEAGWPGPEAGGGAEAGEGRIIGQIGGVGASRSTSTLTDSSRVEPLV